MDGKLAKWLIIRMREKGWSQADLARASGLSRQAISYYLTEKSKQPDEFALQSVARAFNFPPEEIFRVAGLLPPKPENDPLIEEGLHILQQLEGEDKEEALRFLHMRLEVQEQRGKYNARKSKAKTAVT